MVDSKDDILETTVELGVEVLRDPHAELDAVVSDLEALLKNGEVIAALTSRGVNSSIALCATAGLRAYLAGNKSVAADDFATAAEEVRGRMAANEPVTMGPQATPNPTAKAAAQEKKE